MAGHLQLYSARDRLPGVRKAGAAGAGPGLGGGVGRRLRLEEVAGVTSGDRGPLATGDQVQAATADRVASAQAGPVAGGDQDRAGQPG